MKNKLFYFTSLIFLFSTGLLFGRLDTIPNLEAVGLGNATQSPLPLILLEVGSEAWMNQVTTLSENLDNAIITINYDVYDYNVVQGASGEIYPYADLNIFFYLRDIALLEKHIENQTYKPSTGGSASRPSSQPNSLPTFTANASPFDPTFSYPFVRSYLFGEFRLKSNPKYLQFSYPLTTASLQATSVQNLYGLVMIDPLEYDCTPTGIDFFIDKTRGTLNRSLIKSSEEILRIINQEIDARWLLVRTQTQKNKEALMPPQVLREMKMNAVEASLKETPISSEIQVCLRETAEEMQEVIVPFKTDNNKIKQLYTQAQYAGMLSGEERQLFENIISKSDEIINNTETYIAQASALSSLPTRQTSYAHLAVIAETLRICHASVAPTTYEFNLQGVLTGPIAKTYLNKVRDLEAEYFELKSRY